MSMTTTIQQGAAAAEAQARQAAVQAELTAARAQAQADMAAERAAQAEQSMADRIAQDVERAIERGNLTITEQGGRRVIELPGGQKIIMNGRDIHLDGVPVIPIEPQDQIPMAALQTGKQITLFVCMAIAFIVVGLPIARAFARWLDRRGTRPAIDGETAQRLAAIENAVESVAIEVERISEGQRFTTRLLNERAREGVPVGADRIG